MVFSTIRLYETSQISRHVHPAMNAQSQHFCQHVTKMLQKMGDLSGALPHFHA